MARRDRRFDPAALEAAIERCDKNIADFEAAIEKEQNTKKEYRRMLRELEDKVNNPPQVRLEIVRED